MQAIELFQQAVKPLREKGASFAYGEDRSSDKCTLTIRIKLLRYSTTNFTLAVTPPPSSLATYNPAAKPFNFTSKLLLFAGQGRKRGFTLVTIPALGFITQGNFKKGHAVINKGPGVIKVNQEGGDPADAITINPDSSAKLPIEWNRIVITNLSGTDAAQIAIYLKA